VARKLQHEIACEQIRKEALSFAKMVEDFPKFSSSEFLKRYPDYSYDGTDYICRRAEELSDKLSAYAFANESGMARKARKQEAA
jgi:hypothetical protein